MSNSSASSSGIALAAACLAVALVALPSSPAAQQNDDSAEAKKYYKKGMQAFYDEDYAMAITNFKRAHSISPSGTLLFNISLTYSKMAKPEDALEHAEKAAGFDDLPDDTRLKNNARMTGYRTAIQAKTLTGGSRSDRTSDGGEPGSGATTGGASGGAGAPAGTDTHTLRWVGVSIGAAGAGLMGGALAVGTSVSSKIQEKQTAEQNGKFGKADDLYETIQSQQTLGQVLLYTGAATFAAGTTLFIIDAASGSSTGRAVNLVGGPTRHGFRVGVDVDF